MIECLWPSNPARRRYILRMLVSALFSILFSLIAKLSLRYGHLPHAMAYPVALLPAFPIIATLVVTGLYLSEETDEFQRQVLIEAVLGGMAITLAGTTVWGYLENLASAPQLDPIWVYPIFWIAACVCFPIVKMRYR